MNIAVYLVILLAGYLIGFYAKTWLVRRRKFNGVIYVIKNGPKTIYSLELEDDPERIALMKEVVFKVDPSDVDENRE